jgi:hypothetical protein
MNVFSIDYHSTWATLVTPCQITKFILTFGLQILDFEFSRILTYEILLIRYESLSQLCYYFMCFVATPLWAKCEGEAHTPESGNLESSGTPENSELELKGQNTSHWGVLGVIGKVLKFTCLKWPRIGHLDI